MMLRKTQINMSKERDWRQLIIKLTKNKIKINVTGGD